MKKALIVAKTSGFLAQFEMPDIRYLQSLGMEIHCAVNFNLPNYYSYLLDSPDIICHQVDFVRRPLTFDHYRTFRQLKKIIDENDFSLVHCHNPISGALTRLACRKRDIPVIYTAHGFHFYKGCPLSGRLVYKPTEKYLSRYTDTLITINSEDFAAAKKCMHAKRIRYVPGVGIDTGRLEGEYDSAALRKKLGISQDACVLLSVGEVNKNKNHRAVVQAVARLKGYNIVYVVCGTGEGMEKLEVLCAQLGVSDKVLLQGFRRDIPAFNAMADIFVFPSYREGLPIAVMEAMWEKKPVICSRIRGNIDLIDDGSGGICFDPNDSIALSEAIFKLYKNPALRAEMGLYNAKKVMGYTTQTVSPMMREIYDEVLNEK